ncbi:hypothetical protein [Empedobacter brevis]|uniref:hypothetical protein n=1 Tax=Empedobacter brevis TaxID=247 RepID=UPI0003786071|nr:hypothetical protein [Empedobacter brevis]
MEIGIGIGSNSGSENYKYRYNGKELQEELNLMAQETMMQLLEGGLMLTRWRRNL